MVFCVECGIQYCLVVVITIREVGSFSQNFELTMYCRIMSKIKIFEISAALAGVFIVDLISDCKVFVKDYLEIIFTEFWMLYGKLVSNV